MTHIGSQYHETIFTKQNSSISAGLSRRRTWGRMVRAALVRHRRITSGYTAMVNRWRCIQAQDYPANPTAARKALAMTMWPAWFGCTRSHEKALAW